MILALSLFVSSQASPTSSIRSALLIGGVSRGGRRPTPDDAIADMIAAGSWSPPSAGDVVSFRGKNSVWRSVAANKDGWFEDPALENGYLDVQVFEAKAREVILNAKGDSMVYVNGEPRAGDPYSYGYLNLPVHLQAGLNDFLFVAGRGRLAVDLKAATQPLYLQTEDATLPDLLTTDKKAQWGSLDVINASSTFQSSLKISVKAADGGVWQSSGGTSFRVLPYSVRKLPFKIPPTRIPSEGPSKVQISLFDGPRLVDQKELTVQVKTPLQLHKRTFTSGVDGSIQYYAVLPASRPSPSNALVMTLHGASVEATGQAAAYQQKSWATLVAPTNRRPYGFDWEGIGRLDALEVLELAKKAYPHDPLKVDLTGHSMGGHGTWSIGSLYPDLFASIAPSAGWISFWSYAGGWNPPKDSPPLDLLRRSMNLADTLGRVDNTLSEGVYVLHGDADDNVPVQQARTMRQKLTELHHPRFQYHEQPGAGHWWGSQCVDWPPIFSMIASSSLDYQPDKVDFTTQDPTVSSKLKWVTLEQQEQLLLPSRVVASRALDGSITATSTNVNRLRVEGLKAGSQVLLDDQTLRARAKEQSFEKVGGVWRAAGSLRDAKSPARGGPFKQVFANRFLFVVGTHGTTGENVWAYSRAKYNAETMLYRGNGSVDVVLDVQFRPSEMMGRNIILFGNRDTNSAWNLLLGKSPVQFEKGVVRAGPSTYSGSGFGGLLLYPEPGHPGSLVGALAGTGLAGFKQTDRLALFSSGVDYPDWIVFSANAPEKVTADGFFGNDWKYDGSQSAQDVH